MKTIGGNTPGGSNPSRSANKKFGKSHTLDGPGDLHLKLPEFAEGFGEDTIKESDPLSVKVAKKLRGPTLRVYLERRDGSKVELQSGTDYVEVDSESIKFPPIPEGFTYHVQRLENNTGE